MNKWCGTGRLTREPEINSTQSGKTVARFTIACDRRFKKDGDQADFISCVAFEKTAEWLEKYTHKGTKLEIVGRIQTGSYEGKDGKRVYTTDVIVEEANFAESKKTSEEHKEPVETDGFINVPIGVADEMPFA